MPKKKREEYKYKRITRTVGHRIVDGETVPIKKEFRGRTKAEARKKYDDWLKAQNSDFGGDAMWTDLADYYISKVLPVKPYASSTITLYSSVYRKHIRPAFEDILVTAVSAKRLQEYYTDLQVTDAVMRSISKTMSGLYQWMAVNGYSEDLTARLIRPKKTQNKRKKSVEIWPLEDLRKIRDTIGTHRLRFFLYIAMYTGLRASEIKGLKYGDFDFEKNVLSVERQEYKGEIKAPKWGSTRTVPLHKCLKAEYDAHREWHRAEMRRQGYSTDYIFTTSNGHHYYDSTLRTALKRFYNSAGIEYKPLHAYRSTFCTMLCQGGVPIQTASKILGHKSIEVTAQFYTAVTDEEKSAALDNLPL